MNNKHKFKNFIEYFLPSQSLFLAENLLCRSCVSVCWSVMFIFIIFWSSIKYSKICIFVEFHIFEMYVELTKRFHNKKNVQQMDGNMLYLFVEIFGTWQMILYNVFPHVFSCSFQVMLNKGQGVPCRDTNRAPQGQSPQYGLEVREYM